MELGKEEVQPDSPSKGPSTPQQSFPRRSPPKRVWRWRRKQEKERTQSPRVLGGGKCQESETQDESSSTDQSEAESISESSSDEDNDDRAWKRKRGAHWSHCRMSFRSGSPWGKHSDSHPRGPGSIQSGYNEEADRNSCSRRHQRKPQSHGRWCTPLRKRPRSPEPETTRVYKCPRLRRGLVTTLRRLSQAIQVGVVEAEKQQTCGPLSGDQLSLLAQLQAPLTGLVQTLYSMASQAAYVFPAEDWMMPQSPRFAQMAGAPSLPAESWAGAVYDKAPTHSRP